jgi:hypothetical protein
VLLRRRVAHGRVRHVALKAPEPFPETLEPRLGRPPRLRQDLIARPSGATVPMPGHRLLDLGRSSEIWRFEFNQRRPNLNRPMQILQVSPAPLTRAPTAGPNLSALSWIADAPSPPISAHCVPATARSTARSNLGRLLGIVRSKVPDTPSRGNFVKETHSLFGINPPFLVFARRLLKSCRLNPRLLNNHRIRINFIF